MPLEKLKWDGLFKQTMYHFNFLKALFHKIYLVHTWIFILLKVSHDLKIATDLLQSLV